MAGWIAAHLHYDTTLNLIPEDLKIISVLFWSAFS
jgi:hypothetical protein